ncbi:MAG: hypothetical protein J7518_22580 [Nocardioidaceae bacterium]|nr:hypothetical protein [Nocardioidaceae bacterium]
MAADNRGQDPGHLPEDLRVLLTQIVDAHLRSEDESDHDAAVRCCLDAVDFAREDGGPGAGAKARRAAALLLELACPHLSSDTRRELAVACELTALGALVRARPTD